MSLDFSISPVFVLASIAIILSPGPDILYVLARGISHGRKTAVVAAAGFASGLSVHTTLAVCGLSALLVASAVAFTCVKIAGAGYLVYLGIRAWGSRGLISLPTAAGDLRRKRIFAQAFLMNVLNPKVAIFFLAFLPQFIRPELGHTPRQFLILGICFAITSFVIFSLVGIFSSVFGCWITTRPKLARFLDRLVGSIFIAIGVRLALSGTR